MSRSAWLALSWPFKQIYADIVWLISCYRDFKDWIATSPQWFEDWLAGRLTVNVELPAESVVKVDLVDKIDEVLAYLRQSGTRLEAKQPNSEFIECKEWPKGLVIVRNHLGHTLGMGFLQIFGGKWMLGTAAHVAVRAKHGMVLSAGVEGLKHVQISKDAKIGMWSNADVVLIEVPANTASTLGVTKVTMDKTPARDLPVTTYGFVNGRFVSALGLMGRPTGRFGFEHSCSTIAGFSGTPLYRDGKIVGIHSRASGTQKNFGLSLDFLVSSKETPDKTKRYLREQEEWDPDFKVVHQKDDDEDWDEDEHGDRQAYLAWQFEQREARLAYDRENQWSQRIVEGDRMRGKNLGNFRWDDDYGMDYQEYARFDSVFRGALPAGKAGENSTLGGKPTVPEVKPTTSDTLEDSTTSPPEPKAKTKARRNRKKKSTNPSETGNGPQETPKPSGKVLETTPEDFEKATGNLLRKDWNGSEPKSWTQAYSQELFRLAGMMTGDGVDPTLTYLDCTRKAKTLANAMFPPSSAQISTASASSSKTTL